MNKNEWYYLAGVDDAIRALEDLRDKVSGAYEIGILTAISELEKFYDYKSNRMTSHEDGKKNYRGEKMAKDIDSMIESREGDGLWIALREIDDLKDYVRAGGLCDEK